MKVLPSVAKSVCIAAAFGSGRLATAQNDDDLPVFPWIPFEEISPAVPDDPGDGWYFGWKIATYGYTHLVGSKGGAHFFHDDEEAVVIANDGGGDYLGYTVAIDESASTALLGAWRPQGTLAKAFVYVLRSGSSNDWIEQATLDLGGCDSGSCEVTSPEVALSGDGDTAVVSRPDFNSGKGKVWVFVRSGASWGLQTTLEASDGEAGDAFGHSIGISGDLIIVGAPQPGGIAGKTGVAYAYRRDGTAWEQEGDKFTPGTDAPDGLGFGGAVAVDGDTVLVGNMDSTGSGPSGYDVYVYSHSSAGWSLPTKIEEVGEKGQGCFGCSVALRQGAMVAVIGAFMDNSVYFYERDGSDWYLTPSYDGTNGNNAGAGVSVAVKNEYPIVSIKEGDSGSVWIFVNDDTASPTGAPSPAEVEITSSPTRDLSLMGGCVSGVFGDPHITTFDGLRFDCQAAGEFVMVTSIENPIFQVQERFTSIDPSTQATVATGIAIADDGLPKVQVSTPRIAGGSSLNTINTCPIDLYINNVATSISSLPSSGKVPGYDAYIKMLDGGSIRVDFIWQQRYVLLTKIEVRNSATFGCHFYTEVTLQKGYRPEDTILGLLGTCNLDSSDDWRAPTGTNLTIPTTDAERLFGKAYDYCTTNWCIANQIDSIFTYGDGESFDDINKCDLAYDNKIETKVAKPSQDLLDICGSSHACLVDGLYGDAADARAALRTEQNVEYFQESMNPTPLPWYIYHNGMSADFDLNSVNELAVSYVISSAQAYEAAIYQSDCKSAITRVNVTLVGMSRDKKSDHYDWINFDYDFNKTEIAKSSIWNDQMKQISVCHVVRLFMPAIGDGLKMVIAEDKRVLTIDFDLSTGFDVGINLGAGSIGQGSSSTNVDSYIEGCKCDSVQSFTCDPSPLIPNQELIICIKSVSPEVEIDFLESMVVAQGSTSMDVIKNSTVLIPSIASRENVPGMNGVAVSTRVPSNLFSFSAGQSITVRGGIQTKLSGSSVFGRRLLADDDAKNVDGRASYKVSVGLAPSEIFLDEGSSASSSYYVKKIGFISLLGTVVVSFHAML